MQNLSQRKETSFLLIQRNSRAENWNGCEQHDWGGERRVRGRALGRGLGHLGAVQVGQPFYHTMHRTAMLSSEK